MPKFELDPKNRSTSIFDIDRLNLRKDEKARIIILDESPSYEYTHYIMDGTFRDNGSPNGSSYICLGDPATVQKERVDQERCPACNVADASDGSMVKMARRRFVYNVARYRTNARGGVIKPISLQHFVWLFGDDKINKILDRKEEHGDLRVKDIILTCTAQQYQNMDMDVSGELTIKDDKGAIEQLKEIRGSLPLDSDSERLLGKKISFDDMEKLIGQSGSVGDEEVAASVAEVMDSIENVEVAEPTSVSSSPFDESEKEESKDIDLDELLR